MPDSFQIVRQNLSAIILFFGLSLICFFITVFCACMSFGLISVIVFGLITLIVLCSLIYLMTWKIKYAPDSQCFTYCTILKKPIIVHAEDIIEISREFSQYKGRKNFYLMIKTSSIVINIGESCEHYAEFEKFVKSLYTRKENKNV